MSDLSVLPQPALVEEINKSEIFDRMLAAFLVSYKEATGTDFTALTESNPVIRLLRSAAEWEEKNRVQINERFRARLVYFARSANLEALMLEEGLTPAEGESDAIRKERIIVQRTGSSSAGPPEWYERKAHEAGAGKLEDVKVDFPDEGVVRVALLANTETGIPDEETVATVRDALNAPDVHADDHSAVLVLGAEAAPMSIKAQITLEKETDVAVFNALSERLQTAFISRRMLGRDMNWTWVNRILGVDGVHEVIDAGSILPAVQAHQVGTLAELEITLNPERKS